MQFNKILFTSGIECEAYQVISDYGAVLAYLDSEGKEMVLPDGTESHVVEEDAKTPFPADTYRAPQGMPSTEEMANIQDALTDALSKVLATAPTTPEEFETRLREVIQSIR
jgi:hypothetical protein